jgi:RimJ/RimL family protein N-acetyltransferase
MGQAVEIKRVLNSGATLMIRSAREDDAEMCLDYLRMVAGESDFLSFGVGELAVTIEEERNVIAKARQSDNSIILIAEVEREMAGLANFQGGSKPRDRHTGELGITVAKKYWGHGIGRELMIALIEWAGKNPLIHKMNLRARADNERAIELYCKLGFIEEGVITQDMLIDGVFYDCIIMGRQV